MKKNCLKKRFVNADLYLMMVPAIVLLLVFAYFPMYGLTIAFKDYKPYLGIFESSWIGWRNFQNAVFTEGFVDLLKNTLILGALRLLVSFPASIAFAILLNELTIKWFKKTVQTISYLPYFVSWIIIAGISQLFLARDYGFLNHFLELFGAEPVNWYADASNGAPFSRSPTSGKISAGVPSYTLRRSRIFRPNCMRRLRWTGQGVSAKSGASAFPGSCPSSASRSF